MRQAGVLAACGRVALEEEIPRIPEDHRRTARLAEGLRSLPGVEIDPDPPQTNIVFLRLPGDDPTRHERLVARLEDAEIRTMAYGERGLPLIVHRWIDDAAIERTLSRIRQFFDLD